ncbi:MAG: argininosuccinate lyase, partial [Chloroflexota bacterium]|nr:argininosuccinate lyase [Chloroflexota bacterium]
LCGSHLSRLGEELVLWSSAEFGFVEMDDAYATGSSIMPQKKNPDFAELLRGKSGRLTGHLMSLLTVLKGLPLSYNKDLQEDKEPLFDAADTLLACLEIAAELMATLRFNADRMAAAAGQDYTTATDLADYLVRRGLPFREAHGVVGRIVGRGLATGRELSQLTLADLRAESELFEEDALALAWSESSVRARDVAGGTAPRRVRSALAAARRRATANVRRVEKLQAACSAALALLG